jgi:hypothetical protein
MAAARYAGSNHPIKNIVQQYGLDKFKGCQDDDSLI